MDLTIIDFVALILLIFLIWYLSGLKKIDADNIGCILYFGKPIKNVGPGICIVPPILCELKRETRLTIEEQFPIDEAKKEPIRITHGTTTELTGDPLDTRLTTSVSLTCRYKIIDFVAFIQIIGNRFELKRQLRDLLVSTAKIECVKYPLSINLQRIEEINYLLRNAVEKLTKDWGVQIVNVLIEIELGNEINSAQTGVSVSAINIVTNKNNAQKIIADGYAEAEVHKMFQFAKAEGLNSLASKLGIDDKEALYKLDTIGNIFRKSNGDFNLYGSDVQQFFTMIASIYKSANEQGNKLK